MKDIVTNGLQQTTYSKEEESQENMCSDYSNRNIKNTKKKKKVQFQEY